MIVHDENGSLLRRQCGYGLFDLLSQVFQGQITRRPAQRRSKQVRDLRKREVLAKLLLSNVAEAEIDGDPVQPGAKTRAKFEVFQRSEDSNEGLLGDIGSLIVISQHSQGDTINSLLVPCHESIESGLIALQELLDQFMLFGRLDIVQFEAPLVGRSKEVGV